MNDTFNIPNNELKTQVFYSTASGATNQWQTWSKPANAKLIYFTLIGGGGGGAGGRGGISTGNRGGGGGGGGSSITSGFFPAVLLPDTLYIQVGAGGAGGAGSPSASSVNVAGGAGSLSYVSISANTDFANIILASGTVAATGGLGNSSTAGAGGTAFSLTNTIFGELGIVNSIAGQNGGNGTAGAAGTSITPTNLPITGGAGGGGCGSSVSFSGGSINSFAFLPTLLGGASGSTGSNGYDSKVFYNNMTTDNISLFTGGAGGGGLFNGTGGNGGNGSYGSGGGGGGAALNTAPFSGGTGGKGGDGIVIITCI